MAGTWCIWAIHIAAEQGHPPPHSALPILVAYQGSKFNAQHLCFVRAEAKCWVMSHWLAKHRNQNIMFTRWNLHLQCCKQTQDFSANWRLVSTENINWANQFFLVSCVVSCRVSDPVLQSQLPKCILHSGERRNQPSLHLSYKGKERNSITTA